MVRIISFALGLGLSALFFSNIHTTGVTGWVTWMDAIAAVWAFAIGVFAGPKQNADTRSTACFALGFGLMVLWLTALGAHLMPALAWWNFFFACGYLFTGVLEKPGFSIPRTSLGAGRGYGDRFSYPYSYSPLAFGEGPWLGSMENAFDGGPHAGRGPKGYQRSDGRIEEEINEVLTRHGEIDATHVQVKVSDGEVLLSGTVVTRRDRRLVEALVENVSGVRDLHNTIMLAENVQRITETRKPFRAA